MNLLFGIHSHQPVNNFHEVVSEATEKSYYPFLKTLLNYKTVKISVHFSGWLLTWLKNYHKKTFNILKKLSDRGQIEFFTAGFYEPVLSVIPEKDAELQILKLNKFIKDNFGQEPKGLWLTERVWEDKIIKLLVNTGIKYVVVDDSHFISSGYSDNILEGYFLTESEGFEISIFPINKKLRYLVPFKHVRNIVSYLNNIKCGIIFDDGEKFGLWPKTYEWVYEKNWLNNFFETIVHSDFINPLTFNDFFKNNAPLGRVYLPEVSYYEMGLWSLNYNDAYELENFIRKNKFSDNETEKFFKGGIWKNFLVKYEESNNIHKKMLYLSNRIKGKKLSDKALDYLLQSQCNDCLWHGIFGGIYLPNLRDNAFIALNKAENCLDEKSQDTDKPKVFDLNFDGYKEVIFKNSKIIFAVSEKYGGALFELSDRESCFNILNTLTRRKELYHDDILYNDIAETNDETVTTIHDAKLQVSDEIKKELIFDNHLKYAFIEKIFKKEETFENYKTNRINNFYKMEKTFYDKQFIQKGFINILDNKYSLEIIKKFKIEKNGLNVNVVLKNRSNCYFDLIFCEELNFFFQGHSNDKTFIKINENKYKIETELEIDKLREIKVFDNVLNKNIVIKSDNFFQLWSYPFYSVSKSEKSIDKIYQGTTFGLLFPYNFKPDEKLEYIFKITL